MKTPFWFHSLNPVALALLPFAIAYWFLSKLVWTVRLFCRFSPKTPVICVGGLLAGGVGKTPIVREIAGRLNAPVVMRGYRGKNKRAGLPVRLTDAARDVGDEPRMLAESRLAVYVGDRRRNVEALDYRDGARPPAIILDDGFQNPGIKKDISIIVFDDTIGVGNGLLLPAGPLRETLRAGLRRCDAVLIVQGEEGISNALSVARMAKKKRKPVFFAHREMDAKGLFGKYVAFAGIGYPGKFFEALRAVPSVRIVEKIPFSDHHYYDKKDIIRLFRTAREYDARLICTEKDWIKLPRNVKTKVRFVPLKITIQPNFYLWLEKKLGAKDEKDKNENN